MDSDSQQNTNTPVQEKVRLVDVEIVDDSVALNLLVSFLNLAQKRGCFNMDESAKIWECVKRFMKSSA